MFHILLLKEWHFFLKVQLIMINNFFALKKEIEYLRDKKAYKNLLMFQDNTYVSMIKNICYLKIITLR